VGWLAYGDQHDPNLSAFLSDLRKLGWREEANLTLVPRYTQTPADLASHAQELLSRNLGALVTIGLPATRSAKDTRSSVPIVFGALLDPVGNDIVANLTRPEGNLTGIVYLEETIPKLIEVAKELSPQTRGIAHLFEPAARGSERAVGRELADGSDAAGRLGLTYRAFPTSAVDDIHRNLDTAGVEGFDTFIVDNLGLLQFHRWPIARQALDRRMKAIGREREFAAIGGLASFGEESLNLYRRMAAHVDKILKGTPVAEIPVERAAKFELVLNQQTAKRLGITIPLALLARADEVIE
jgi:putative ABC transport system substrate-binding protein